MVNNREKRNQSFIIIICKQIKTKTKFKKIRESNGRKPENLNIVIKAGYIQRVNWDHETAVTLGVGCAYQLVRPRGGAAQLTLYGIITAGDRGMYVAITITWV